MSEFETTSAVNDEDLDNVVGGCLIGIANICFVD
jgi:hypothetical protein